MRAVLATAAFVVLLNLTASAQQSSRLLDQVPPGVPKGFVEFTGPSSLEVKGLNPERQIGKMPKLSDGRFPLWFRVALPVGEHSFKAAIYDMKRVWTKPFTVTVREGMVTPVLVLSEQSGGPYIVRIQVGALVGEPEPTGAELLSGMCESFASSPLWTRWRVARELSELDSRESTDCLIRYTEDPEWTVRLQAVVALRGHSREDIPEILFSVLSKALTSKEPLFPGSDKSHDDYHTFGEWRERNAVINEMVALGHPQTVEVLRQCLQGPVDPGPCNVPKKFIRAAIKKLEGGK
jgi:hypothetical protein